MIADHRVALLDLFTSSDSEKNTLEDISTVSMEPRFRHKCCPIFGYNCWMHIISKLCHLFRYAVCMDMVVQMGEEGGHGG